VVADEGREITIVDAADMAVKAIAWNYRVSRHEVQALRLLDTENYADVLLVVIDWEGIEEGLKKKASGELDSSSGSEDT